MKIPAENLSECFLLSVIVSAVAFMIVLTWIDYYNQHLYDEISKFEYQLLLKQKNIDLVANELKTALDNNKIIDRMEFNHIVDRLVELNAKKEVHELEQVKTDLKQRIVGE